MFPPTTQVPRCLLHHHTTTLATRYPSCTYRRTACVPGLHCCQTAFSCIPPQTRHLLPAVFRRPSSVFHHTPATRRPHHPASPLPLPPRNPSSIASNVSASHWLVRIHTSQQSLAAHSPGYPRKTDTCTLGAGLVPRTRSCKRPSQPARRPAPSRPPSLSLCVCVKRAFDSPPSCRPCCPGPCSCHCYRAQAHRQRPPELRI